MAINVSDAASNRDEQIENAAKAIGTSGIKRSVFEAIHHGKKAVKTVSEIAAAAGLTEKQVLDAAKPFVKKQLITQMPTKVNGRTAYQKNEFLQAHKAQILRLSKNKHALDSFPTKRKPQSAVTVTIKVPSSTANVTRITIDDIGSFKKTKSLVATDHISDQISESTFKKGIQKILGEPGKFTDWGGEKNDLLSTRLLLNGKRKSVAFAFKGPGTKGALTPKKMGKNGNQIQQLFHSPAEVFILQYWREIHEDVLEQMQAMATAKSATSGQPIWFGLIDGFDSRRIYDAYTTAF